MRRALTFAGVAIAGAAVALAVAHLAVGIGLPGNARESRANLQQLVWSAEDDSTTSQTWETIANLHGSVCTRTPVSATVSLALQGGPAEIRVLRDGVRERRQRLTRPLRPGPVATDPSAGSPVTFNFIDPSRGRGFLTYEVQWRSPTGAEIRFDRGTAAFGFARGPRQACPQ